MTAAAARRARAKKGLLVYFAVLVPLSAAVEGAILSTGRPIGESTALVLLLMWSPAIASVVARLALREGIRDVSFRAGGRRGLAALGVAWVYPLPVALLAYGAAWGAGLADFRLPALLSGLPVSSPFLALVVTMATAGTLVSCLSAAGEEIGWRGYMLTRLVEAGVPQPVLLSGVVWAAWHLPLILSGQYAAGPKPHLSAAAFVGTVVAVAWVMARLRLESGSVWPAVLLHASWNAVVQGAFDASTPEPGIWVGEGGLLLLLVNGALAIVVVRGRWPFRRSPAEAPFDGHGAGPGGAQQA